MDTLSLILIVIGALNWGLVGIFQFDLVAAIFGGMSGVVSRIIYWGIDRVVAQDADGVHTVVRRRVDLQNVHAPAGVDGPAGRTGVARIAVL